jgi:hypothetical protein
LSQYNSFFNYWVQHVFSSPYLVSFNLLSQTKLYNLEMSDTGSNSDADNTTQNGSFLNEDSRRQLETWRRNSRTRGQRRLRIPTSRASRNVLVKNIVHLRTTGAVPRAGRYDQLVRDGRVREVTLNTDDGPEDVKTKIVNEVPSLAALSEQQLGG